MDLKFPHSYFYDTTIWQKRVQVLKSFDHLGTLSLAHRLLKLEVDLTDASVSVRSKASDTIEEMAAGDESLDPKTSLCISFLKGMSDQVKGYPNAIKSFIAALRKAGSCVLRDILSLEEEQKMRTDPLAALSAKFTLQAALAITACLDDTGSEGEHPVQDILTLFRQYLSDESTIPDLVIRDAFRVSLAEVLVFYFGNGRKDDFIPFRPEISTAFSGRGVNRHDALKNVFIPHDATSEAILLCALVMDGRLQSKRRNILISTHLMQRAKSCLQFIFSTRQLDHQFWTQIAPALTETDFLLIAFSKTVDYDTIVAMFQQCRRLNPSKCVWFDLIEAKLFIQESIASESSTVAEMGVHVLRRDLIKHVDRLETHVSYMSSFNDPKPSHDVEDSEVVEGDEGHVHNETRSHALRDRLHVTAGIGRMRLALLERSYESRKEMLIHGLNHFNACECSEPWEEMAMAFSLLRDIRKAIRCVEKAVAFRPGRISSWTLLILLLSSQKKFADCHALCRSLVHQFPNELLFYVLRGWSEFFLGRVKESGKTFRLLFAELRRWIEEDEVNGTSPLNVRLKLVKLLCLTSDGLSRVGLMEEAVQCLRHADEFQVLHFVRHYQSGLVAERKDDIRGAVVAFQQSLAHNAMGYLLHGRVHTSLASVFIRQKNFVVARHHLETALEGSPIVNPRALYHMGVCLKALDRGEEGDKFFIAAEKLERTEPMYPFEAIYLFSME
eukprot:TRINITY_DN5214_c0_g1_i1.p1 TRINITY_DN5214_c0_g1~~TRINITY_DN5214_c0_g1_i1.p1  ORF type:complete len:726 (+),score=178.84 TRINITY_DN5214_c0_g1_i1:1401-3578(+)